MSALDDIIKEHAKHDPRRGYEKRDAATAELAQLRADLQAAQERIAQLEAAQAFSDAEQARQLDAARSLIIRSGRVVNNLKKPDSVYDLTSDLLEWLAANPAPQVEQP